MLADRETVCSGPISRLRRPAECPVAGGMPTSVDGAASTNASAC